MVDNNKTFNSIKTFVYNLNECYGDDYNGLSLYNTLLQKTTNSHTEFISKTINIFKNFCYDNENYILNKTKDMSSPKIVFSDKIFIDMKLILDECDNSEKETIWKHIALIYSHYNPHNNVKEMLTQKPNNESNFIKDMINKVEDTIEGDNISNPMEAITKMMTSGVFSELVGNMTNGLQSGDLNIGSLLGSVNDMVGTMNGGNDNSGMNLVSEDVGEKKSRNRNRKKKKKRRK